MSLLDVSTWRHGSHLPLAFGLLRLATEGRPAESEAIALIHEALDAGIRWIDTASSYCLDERDKHYGERLAIAAWNSWSGPKEEVVIATKVGMSRPKGKWVPDGSGKSIRKTVEGSLAAMSVEQLPMVQLHVRDPRSPFVESLETLAQLQAEDKIQEIGLCNVDPLEMEQANRYFRLASVQNELSVVSRAAASDGSLALAERLNIPFFAYRPLGGHAKVSKLATNRTLAPLAKKHSVTPEQVAIAVLCDLGAPVIPLFGASRRASLVATLQALRLKLDDEDREWIRSKVSFEASEESKLQLEMMKPRSIAIQQARVENPGPSDSPEIVLLMGIQGAGKSHLVEEYTDRGYLRLNRDVLGGRLTDLIPKLVESLDEGEQRIVLDNTYPTQTSRAPVIHVANYFGLPVRCRYLATSPADARFNIAARILKRYGKLLGPEEMKEMAEQDSNLPPPVALQRWIESFEPPTTNEGFTTVEQIPFSRMRDPTWKEKGLLLDVDGTLRKTLSGELYPRSADDVELLPHRREVLMKWMEDGYKLFFVSNQSGVASGKVAVEEVEAAFQRTIDLLGLPVTEVAYCPHPAFPAGCFCRKPMPGLGVHLMMKHHLSFDALVMVGDMDSDREFAQSLGARYFEASEFFAMR